MKIVLASVGTRIPGWVDEAFDDYAERLPARSARGSDRLPPGARIVALDERGALRSIVSDRPPSGRPAARLRRIASVSEPSGTA